jgi:hypothetical protein
LKYAGGIKYKKLMKHTKITYLGNLGNFFVSGEMWKRKSKEITHNGQEEENSELM